MKIWKYSLGINDLQLLRMPPGAKLLTVQMQHELPQLWVLFDENAGPSETRAIAIYGTGNPMPDDPGQYIATFQTHGGDLVWHAFEVKA